MQDVSAYCTQLVRTADRDRFLAALFAPAQHRDALYALYAFNVELTRVREAAREPLPGEIRLQWWSEVIGGVRGDEARANPVASALLAAIDRHRLPPAKLLALIEAHRFDLYDKAMATLADLEAYAKKTSSAVIAIAAQILAGDEMEEVAQPAGIACAIVGVLRGFPLHAARGQLYVPRDILERHRVLTQDIFAGRSSDGLAAAIAELRDLGRRYLASTREAMTSLPDEALPALLPVALVRPWLERLERSAPFSPAEISPWRRQWLIWRAARHPARVAG